MCYLASQTLRRCRCRPKKIHTNLCGDEISLQDRDNICIFYHLFGIEITRVVEIRIEDKGPFILRNHYCGCRWPGFIHCQVICSQYIYIYIYRSHVYSCFSEGFSHFILLCELCTWRVFLWWLYVSRLNPYSPILVHGQWDHITIYPISLKLPWRIWKKWGISNINAVLLWFVVLYIIGLMRNLS